MLPVYAVSDIHGHVDELLQAVHDVGLIDDAGDWRGDAQLWALGDYVDRGPDGIAVLDLLRRWQRQAAARPGTSRVEALLGNHEVLALGMRWFGTRLIREPGPARKSFSRSWLRNGGQRTDQARLTDDHVSWLVERPLMARVGDWLVMHSDTDNYLRWGDDLDAINAGGQADLASRDPERVWGLWRRLTARGSFARTGGVASARDLTTRLGGRRIIHGHSTIGDLLAIDPAAVEARPYIYADDHAVAIDGGRCDGGPLLLVRLDQLASRLSPV